MAGTQQKVIKVEQRSNSESDSPALLHKTQNKVKFSIYRILSKTAHLVAFLLKYYRASFSLKIKTKALNISSL